MWSKGVFTTTQLIKELSERQNISEKEAKYIVETFIDTVGYIANETDNIGVKIYNFGVFYLKKKTIPDIIDRLKERFNSATSQSGRNKYKRLVKLYQDKLNYLGNSNTKFYNYKKSFLSHMSDRNRLNKSEMASKQNEFVNENNK